MSLESFGHLSDGREVHRVTLSNGTLSVSLLTLGAIIQDVRLDGVDFPLTLGGRTARDYDGTMAHFGAIMGPVANRIRDARAEIDGETLSFDPNQDGQHTRHGGKAAFHRKIWRITDRDDDSVTFTLDVEDGEGGFPGKRRIEARYAIEGSSLIVELRGATDKPTLMNLACHGYWTMQPPGDWSGQHLRIAADRYLPTTDDNLPTGEIADVAGTPYDFREGVTLDTRTAPKLDNNFCLAEEDREMTSVATLTGPTGLTLEVSTTAPGLQLFGMGSFSVEEDTIHGAPYPKFAGLAFEPQHWPDAPTHPAFPSIVLRPGDVYEQLSRYEFTRAAG
ncbi:aldose epimerase family protein [Palleronia sp. LCG004]|uniref:aldose epimerase family protein n=1 Tax=Palleronia sp. LCG004 TaxID=3079304 RepID=UPI002943538C|nr:aldose epimerase family protein [Palleronia sp. LCG004]WOI55526.1 aldose epimerase family protein [Palleronia sp. LCG004]